MLVRLCPKCGTENKPDRASCSGCYARLDAVAPTEAKERPAPAQAPSAAQVQSAVRPMAPNIPPADMRPPYNAAPVHSRPPAKRGPNLVLIGLLVVVAIGGGIAAWRVFFGVRIPTSGPTPAQVVQQMYDACKTGNDAMLKSCCTKDSQEGAIQIGKASRERGPGTSGRGWRVGATTFEEGGAVALVETISPDPAKDPSGKMVLVPEDGQWKISIKLSLIRALKEAFSQSPPGASQQKP